MNSNNLVPRRNAGGFTSGKVLPVTGPTHSRNFVFPNDTAASGFSVPQGPLTNLDIIDTMLNLQ